MTLLAPTAQYLWGLGGNDATSVAGSSNYGCPVGLYKGVVATYRIFNKVKIVFSFSSLDFPAG